MRKISCLFVFVLAVIAVACGGRQRVHIAPEQPATVQNVLPPPMPLIRNCWDPALRVNQYGVQYAERFGNTSNVWVVFKITEKISGEIICFGPVRPGGQEIGPATWVHKSPTSDWGVTATFYVPGVNSARTEGTVEDRTAALEYVRQDGWYTRCPC